MNMLGITNQVPWTFKTWIKNFRDVDLPIGDLAKDICEDEQFPEDDNFYELNKYFLNKCKQNPQGLQDFITAWNFYLASNADPGMLEVLQFLTRQKYGE